MKKDKTKQVSTKTDDKFTLTQLRSMADEIENRQKIEVPKQLVEQGNRELKGKCFRSSNPVYDGFCMVGVRFTGFKVRFDEATATVDTVTMSSYRKGTYLPITGVFKQTDRRDFKSLYDYEGLVYGLKPMSPSEFEDMWGYPDKMVDIISARFNLPETLTGCAAGYQYDTKESLNESEENVDIPFIQLKPYEYDKLPCRFRLPYGRYILTPESRRAGIAHLQKSSAGLDSCSYLYEACDMPYVNTSRDTIAKLMCDLLQKG